MVESLLLEHRGFLRSLGNATMVPQSLALIAPSPYIDNNGTTSAHVWTCMAMESEDTVVDRITPKMSLF